MYYFIIPGLGNSGPEHWQTYFESLGDNFYRINQEEWDAPDCETWIDNIDKAIMNFDPSQVVLIGHSLGCTAIAHWYVKYRRIIKGAMLVAPSDIEAKRYSFTSTGFTPIPLETLPFKSIVVTSANDEWVSIERARYFADAWGSDFINIGDAGHINTLSGHYKWELGLSILKQIQ